jgi:hypothetical protein
MSLPLKPGVNEKLHIEPDRRNAVVAGANDIAYIPHFLKTTPEERLLYSYV